MIFINTENGKRFTYFDTSCFHIGEIHELICEIVNLSV